MASVLYMAVYLFCGVAIIQWLLPRHRVLNRIWLGLSLGLLLEMWLPALLAFLMRFTIAAHLTALVPLAALTGGCFFLRDKRPARQWDEEETHQLKQLLFLLVPFTMLSGYLQYTHNMRVDAMGNWNVGQSTYGDLPMHMAFITGMKNAAFPVDYPFFPGAQLSYPFLTDSLSTTFYLMGCTIQWAIIIPGTLMMMLCCMGVLLLAREMTMGKKTILLAALLFFLNGGLGFLYDFDLAGGTQWDGTPTWWSRVQAILQGYYKTPTNQPDPNNLRWSNVIADLMIPQRTLLGGWCHVIPCFYLLYTAFAPEKRELRSARSIILLGVWAGALPLIQTHAFLALGLASAGVMIYDLTFGTKQFAGDTRINILKRYLLYAVIAVLVAAPQLICFTFAQAFMNLGTDSASSHSFLVFQFNWCNNRGGNGMVDMYFWFYMKNIGLPFLLLILAAFEKNPKWRRILSGAFAIILAAELIRFQPNEYDNNKLFYLAYLLCVMVVADYMALLWQRLKGLRARPVIAVLTAVVLFLSAGLTLWRECVSDYQAFNSAAVEAGEWARDNTEEHSIFITGNHHLNPISSIAGRTTVCGPDLWLYYHGFNTSERQDDLRRFYEDPADNLDVIEKYGAKFISVSSYERSNYDVNTEALNELFVVVFQNRECTIYSIGEG